MWPGACTILPRFATTTSDASNLRATGNTAALMPVVNSLWASKLTELKLTARSHPQVSKYHTLLSFSTASRLVPEDDLNRAAKRLVTAVAHFAARV